MPAALHLPAALWKVLVMLLLPILAFAYSFAYLEVYQIMADFSSIIFHIPRLRGYDSVSYRTRP